MKAAQLGNREYKQLSALLMQWTGINLHGKEHLMLGRLQHRLRAMRLTSFRDYLHVLETGGRDGAEAQNFINALTTNKTSFFREAHHFEFLVNKVFAEARTRALKTRRKSMRLWSAGCSRGAEPYTMAMLAAEHLPIEQGWDVRILATDIDTEILDQAQDGVYDDLELDSVPESLRRRFFTRVPQGHKIEREAAGLVTFAQANLIAEPFPVRGTFDAVFCRNVMIYFDQPTQARIVSALVSRLAPSGYLVIGHSESMVAQHLPRVQGVVGVYQPVANAQSAPRRSRSPAALAPARPGPVKRKSTAPKKARARPAPPVDGLPLKRIVLGEWFASAEPTLVSTLLGSCVAACLYDPVARVGGMNHFMLPGVDSQDANSARFGVHAMEVLINELMQLGAERSRLRAMAFGAGAVNRALNRKVSAGNGAFIRHFLAKEKIPLVIERLGGEEAREVFLRTDTGEAFVRRVQARNAAELQSEEVAAYRKKAPAPVPFNPDDALF